MRSSIFILLILLPLSILAQTLKPLGKGWQVSFGVETEILGKSPESRSPFVKAADTLAIPPNTVFLFSLRSTREIDLGNGPVTYYEENGYDFEGELSKRLARFISSVQFHYRYNNNISVGIGLAYSSYKREYQYAYEEALPVDYIVVHSRSTNWLAGFRNNVTYNFLPNKRLQPYVGLRLDFFLDTQNYKSTTLSAPGLGIEQDMGVLVAERFRTNRIFDLDINLLIGLNYRLSERYALGLVSHLVTSRMPPTTLQVRYIFPRKD